MSTPDIDAMSPREFSAGLMRGYRPDFKTGYSAASAAAAVAQRKSLSERSTRELLDWSLGFHDGMHDALSFIDPEIEEGPKRPGLANNTQYLQGRIKGRSENPETLNPSSPQPSASDSQ